ncbi:MAG: anthrone oxygenase family protein [Bacteroidota bacterium]|nr:anthrone oxygenase family protein [Bacteroidota bacterium]
MGNSINFGSLQISQLAAVLLTGLVAGLFYGYQCSVIRGLGELNTEVYLSSFQSINKVIQNPVFFLSFMGNLVVLPIACWLCYKQSSLINFYLILAATLLYYFGVFGVTVAGNVPLNNQLNEFLINGSSQNEMEGMRSLFEKPWNRYHSIRTVLSIVSFCLATLSLFRFK